MTLQVPYRDNESSEDTNDGVIIYNDLSGMKAREGTRVTFEIEFNANKPNAASDQKDATWVRHAT